MSKSSQKKTFIFHDPCLCDETKYTAVTITVTREKYGDSELYCIVYDYTYSPNNIVGYEGHPFKGTEYEEHEDGDNIMVNEMSTSMIKYLLMDYDKMKDTGNTTPQDYKKNIMYSISLFWD
jgi:hypothetical protein